MGRRRHPRLEHTIDIGERIAALMAERRAEALARQTLDLLQELDDIESRLVRLEYLLRPDRADSPRARSFEGRAALGRRLRHTPSPFSRPATMKTTPDLLSTLNNRRRVDASG